MINHLVNLGVKDGLKIEDAQLVRLTNILALFPLPIYIFYIGYGYYFNQWFSSALASSMILLTLVSLRQNALHHYGLAKFVLILLNGFSLWITYHVFNIDYSVLTGFLPLLVCYAFFFDFVRERNAFIASALFTIFFIVSSFLLPRQVIHAVNLSPADAYVSNLFHLAFSFLLTIFLVYAIFRHTKITRDKLISAREEAERYSRLQSEFLANMSHEIRTPLNGVIGSAQLLGDTPLNPEQEEYAQTIDLSSQMLMELIDNILDLSKLEAHRIQIENTDFDLTSTFKDLVAMLKPSLGNKSVDLDLELDKDEPRFVYGDKKRIKQVLSNLIGNAIKFTDKGKIVLSLKRVKKTASKSSFAIAVSDTGIGISEEDQKKLFTRFYQVESSADRRYMGSGLGLVISKNLLQLMGGTVGLKSVLGKGTTFDIKLAFQTSKSAPKVLTQEPQETKNVSHLKVLVAEDNEVNLVVMIRILAKLGLEVDIARDGLEAFDKAVNTTYDLIFMDIQMPGKDGIQATKEIRKALSHAEKPLIVALTANAMAEDREKCLEVGMNDYLSKPVSSAEIASLLYNWF